MAARVRVPPGPPRDLQRTVEMLHFLGDLGTFEGRRARLVDGGIVEEGPMNPPHAVAATNRTRRRSTTRRRNSARTRPAASPNTGCST
jgi:hypothetical protein